MARLSRTEVSEKYPIADGLDTFRRTFEDFYTKSGILSGTGRETFRNDLHHFISVVDSSEFEVLRLFALLNAVLDRESDVIIWDNAYATIAQSTPSSPKLTPYPFQTPHSLNTSSFVNSYEKRKYVDAVLEKELGSIYIGIPNFGDVFFCIEGLKEAAATVFQRCQEGDSPLFTAYCGWQTWPESAKEREVLAQPNRPLEGSTVGSKLDIGIITSSTDRQTYDWSQVLVLGELKSNPKDNMASNTWRDLGRYAREVFRPQSPRRFSLGFTLCGSITRLWEFDRLGAIASLPFDINRDALRFISVMLGFFTMNNSQIGYDPTFLTSLDGKYFIEVIRNGQTERLVVDEIMKRAPCIAGRATTCWKAHNSIGEVFVVKDSWQYPERELEGSLLREATNKGVINVARYYHDEIVQVNSNKADDVRSNVRGGIDITQATSYKSIQSGSSLGTGGTADTTRIGRSRSQSSRKRSSSRLDMPLPPSKRACSGSPTKHQGGSQTREHRRVIVRDYGIPIYKNLPSGNRREVSSGAKGKTGTRAFMAIGLLFGEKNSFTHDLESFFWVIFWICIHGRSGEVNPKFERWNYLDTEELAYQKLGIIPDETVFEHTVQDSFLDYYKPLIPCILDLRKAVSPGGKFRRKEDKELYSQIRQIIENAQKTIE
ncbi:hypothetical protein BDV26DRAFT_286337 [Aspergillus bertholletiae]|uniref:Fungal-type protein kinase domain-containing protein n=1 Tax=Aspergillus bertholletiae TaxID=1226010 RepID=A0A5N7AQ47_9EURO|nr:hypothetical protein BDV26DRAFT_286337 [Aspergillus bertholletiae]